MYKLRHTTFKKNANVAELSYYWQKNQIFLPTDQALEEPSLIYLPDMAFDEGKVSNQSSDIGVPLPLSMLSNIPQQPL